MSKLIFITGLALSLSIASITYADANPKITKIEQVDQEIIKLEKELKRLRQDAFNQEMNAQPYMFDNWSEYTENINANEIDEKKIIDIKAKIEDLKILKQKLMKSAK